MQLIPLSSLGQYPSSVATSGLDAHAPAVDALRDLSRFSQEHRATLVDAVESDLRDWSAPPAALAAAERLREPGAYAVITGQQAGIATGPLYSLYKALGAVRVAQELRIEHPDHVFVAVFWIEGDDHDFDEARTLGVIDRSGLARSLAYDDGDSLPRHVGDRRVRREAFETFLAELRETLIATEFTDSVVGLLERAYLGDGATLASGFARSMYEMLGDVPLVVVSSRNPRLKWLARDVFEREARDPDALHAALTTRTEQLSAAGASTPITPKRGGLFITHEQTRRALDAGDGDGYTVREAGTRYTRDELAALARSSPELLSPNVALRPIVQDAIFPTAAYVGGPSELAYLEQITAAYATFELEAPAFVQRPFVLLVEPKSRKAIEARGLTVEQVMREDFVAASHVVDAAVDGQIDAARERALATAREGLQGFEPLTKQIDPTLEKALGATGASIEKSVDDYAKRLRSALKRRSQTDIDRLESARELLLPGRELQERTLNAVYYINKYGLARVQHALEQIEAHPGALQVIDV